LKTHHPSTTNQQQQQQQQDGGDWKSRLQLPQADTRIKTEARQFDLFYFSISFYFFLW